MTNARKIGVFNYECEEGHGTCSNDPSLEDCPWPTSGSLSTCGAPMKELCWVFDFEYLDAIAERDEALAEAERLRVALTKLSDCFHPGMRAEFEEQPVRYYANLIAAALGAAGVAAISDPEAPQ